MTSKVVEDLMPARPKTFRDWLAFIAIIMAAGATLQMNRVSTAANASTLPRVEALERRADRSDDLYRQTAELQRDSAAINQEILERLRQIELDEAKDSERLAQIRADLDRVRGVR